MRTVTALLASIATVGALCLPAAAHPVGRTLDTVVSAAPVEAGAIAGIGVYNGWWADATHVPADAVGAHSLVAGLGAGVVASAGFLASYEAIACKTFGSDFLNWGCKHLSWRDPNWRDPHYRHRR